MPRMAKTTPSTRRRRDRGTTLSMFAPETGNSDAAEGSRIKLFDLFLDPLGLVSIQVGRAMSRSLLIEAA
ncbi:MAG: hypothetical protein ACK5QX_05475 [bacterium]